MDPWAVLGVAPGSSQRAVRAAYIRRSKQLHPDLGGTVEAMQQLNAAYHSLSSGSGAAPAPQAGPAQPPTGAPAPQFATRSANVGPPKAPRVRKAIYRRPVFYAALAGIGAVIAGSGVTTAPDPDTLPRSDRNLVGTCIVIDGDAFTRTESCAAPHDARVTAVVLRTEACPQPWTAYFNRNYDRVCVDERQ